MATIYPTACIGEVASPIERPEVPQAGITYRQIGVRLWGIGAYERESIDGSQTKYATLSRVESGDIVVNKIWARNGSVAVVSDDLSGCFGSGEFATFEPNRQSLDPRWFHWITKSKWFWQACDEKSQGTSGKNRIRPEKFLEIEIPLPPLEEQRRIVARIEALSERITVAQALRKHACDETNALEQHIYRIVWNLANNLCLKNHLENYASVLDPQPDHRTPAEFIDGMPYVSIANISSTGEVDIEGARKVSPSAIEKQERAFTLCTGDIVLGKIGTIGAARPIVVRTRFALSANVVLVQPDRSKVDAKFLLALLKSPQMGEQFSKGINTTAQSAFGIKKMRKLLIPVPPVSEQRCIVTYMDKLQGKVNRLLSAQAETERELAALMPSVLDRAFKGEL